MPPLLLHKTLRSDASEKPDGDSTSTHLLVVPRARAKRRANARQFFGEKIQDLGLSLSKQQQKAKQMPTAKSDLIQEISCSGFAFG